jgi:hypothetical protein
MGWSPQIRIGGSGQFPRIARRNLSRIFDDLGDVRLELNLFAPTAAQNDEEAVDSDAAE